MFVFEIKIIEMHCMWLCILYALQSIIDSEMSFSITSQIHIDMACCAVFNHTTKRFTIGSGEARCTCVYMTIGNTGASSISSPFAGKDRDKGVHSCRSKIR